MAGSHRIRIRLRDGEKSSWNKVKPLIGTDVDVHDVPDPGTKGSEFVVGAKSQDRIDRVRAELTSKGFDEVVGGSTDVEKAPASVPRNPPGSVSAPAAGRSASAAGQQSCGDIPKRKPYGFVPLPETFDTAEPVWHDGSTSDGRLSGEIRFEMENLTPLLVGWERQKIVDETSIWPVRSSQDTSSDLAAYLERAACQNYPDQDKNRSEEQVRRSRQDFVNKVRNRVVKVNILGVDRTIESKSILCPLRAPWGIGPVIIPGDSLKGLLRDELGALLGAPMHQVGERSYSYRPNLKFPDDQSGRRLEPRVARVKSRGTVQLNGVDFPVPSHIEVFGMATRKDQQYYPRRQAGQIVNPSPYSEPYRGGMGGGQRLPDAVLSSDARRRIVHTSLDATNIPVKIGDVQLQHGVLKQYRRTLEHLLSPDHGHYSGRHPQVGNDVQAGREGVRAVTGAARNAFQIGDLIWVEWDVKEKKVVSFGWHYYYRWAYQDTVHWKNWTDLRNELCFLPEERERPPAKLSAVRRLFGYASENAEPKTGSNNYSQLMGRIAINAALEIVPSEANDAERFLEPTFLKELGMPRPSAVEFYLQQPYYPQSRPSDKACTVTYGDAAGYDEPGKLSGRKFYLDREDAYRKDAHRGTPWRDHSPSNRLNDRSTLALEASQPGRSFRFTLRFRDLDPSELAATLLALGPDQFRNAVAGKHPSGYCSKLGYARPLGWGTIRIRAREMYLLGSGKNGSVLNQELDLDGWFHRNFKPPPLLDRWLEIHRHRNPDAGDYPSENGQIYTFHANRRAEHTRLRRYERRSE